MARWMVWYLGKPESVEKGDLLCRGLDCILLVLFETVLELLLLDLRKARGRGVDSLFSRLIRKASLLMAGKVMVRWVFMPLGRDV